MIGQQIISKEPSKENVFTWFDNYRDCWDCSTMASCLQLTFLTFPSPQHKSMLSFTLCLYHNYTWSDMTTICFGISIPWLGMGHWLIKPLWIGMWTALVDPLVEGLYLDTHGLWNLTFTSYSILLKARLYNKTELIGCLDRSLKKEIRCPMEESWECSVQRLLPPLWLWLQI